VDSVQKSSVLSISKLTTIFENVMVVIAKVLIMPHLTTFGLYKEFWTLWRYCPSGDLPDMMLNESVMPFKGDLSRIGMLSGREISQCKEIYSFGIQSVGTNQWISTPTFTVCSTFRFGVGFICNITDRESSQDISQSITEHKKVMKQLKSLLNFLHFY